MKEEHADSNSNLLESILDRTTEPRDVPFALLDKITGNFSQEQIIGDGGFAVVYKGVLQNGKEVAVKKIMNHMTINETPIKREVTNLMQVNHENIVRFLGYCFKTVHTHQEYEGQLVFPENREMLLCFEYINKGSLDKYITDELRGLEWDTRYNIIKGLCNGLKYLHVEREIAHMDLKPANILLDNDMMTKITDFGLSRMSQNFQTITLNQRVGTQGYWPPEYVLDGKVSYKYDVYSLGVIIIELVTGCRETPNLKNVLRRWRHILKKLGKGTPFRYQQVAKLIEIGLICKDPDHSKRPSISEIISDMNELEGREREINNANETTIGQICVDSEDDMLGIEPLELRYPIELNKQTSRSVKLTNETNGYIAFFIHTKRDNRMAYFIETTNGIVAPQHSCSINIILERFDKAAQDKKHPDTLIVRSTKVNDYPTSKVVIEDVFKEDDGKVVDEVNVTVTHVDLPSSAPTEAESEVNQYASHELIKFEPPELRFLSVPHKRVLSSVKIVNLTDSYVGCVAFHISQKSSTNYGFYNGIVILSPWSTDYLVISREQKEEEQKEMNEKFFVWNCIVPEGFKKSDLTPTDVNAMDVNVNKELPVVLTEISPCTSDEVIQIDPPELSFPLLPNVPLVSTFNISNNTDFSIGFCVLYVSPNVGPYTAYPGKGIIPPRATQRMIVKRVPQGKESLDNMKCKSRLFIWSMIVSEGVEAQNLGNMLAAEITKELPIILKKARPHKTILSARDFFKDELIHFHPHQLNFPFLANKTSLSFINMSNITYHPVSFSIYVWKAKARYYTEPRYGILAPRSTQTLVVKRVPTGNEPQDMKWQNTGTDKFIIWNAIVAEGAQAGDHSCITQDKEGTELPNHDLYDNYAELRKRSWWSNWDFVLFANIVHNKEYTGFPISLTKINLSTTNDLIEIEPPELCFPLISSGSQTLLVKIVNITDYFLGFNIFEHKTNVASYDIEPQFGILSPRSTQELVVTRVPKEEESLEEIMQSKDKYFLWTGFVTKGVNSIYLKGCTSETDSKELPIFFMKKSSNELIRFDPPNIYFPLLSNRSVLSSVKIVNRTDHSIRFSICSTKNSSARYYIDPSKGILSPSSTQVIMLTRVANKNELKNKKCKEYLVWSRVVPEGVIGSGISDQIVERECKELPIVLTKTTPLSTSEELIRFDPPMLSFPILPNRTVLSSVTVINNTDFNIGLRVKDWQENVAVYKADPHPRILPPHSTYKIVVKRVPTEDIHGCKKGTHIDMLPSIEKKREKEMLLVWYMILAEGIEAHNLIDYKDGGNIKELPIVLTETIPCTSKELIQFDPPQICFPFLPNKTVLSSFNMVNTTYYSVLFCNYVWNAKAKYYTEPRYGILPPRSTQKLVVKRVPTENEPQDMKCKDKYILWNAIVTEGVKASDLSCVMNDEDGTELQNYDLYDQTLEQARGTFQSWTNFLSYDWVKRQKENTELPIVLTKVQHLFAAGSSRWPFSLSFAKGMNQRHLICSSTANDVIKIEPLELCFPFLLTSEGQKCSVNIVNITDHVVGFNTFGKKTNVASYNTEPLCGILPPNSTQELVVTRVAHQQEALEDMMHCKDKYYLWSSFVTQGVDAINLKGCTSKTESKHLPIVFAETSSNEWIQFYPPELSLPLLSNKSVLSPVHILNLTNHHISFNICTKSNSARYYTDPSKGILPPRSSQVLKVIREAEEKELHDTVFKDKYLVWNSVVTQGAEASNVVPSMSTTKITELPIVLTETPQKVLIQFDRSKLCFPLLAKGKALSSVNIVNITDSYIGFSIYSRPENAAWYHTEPSRGILPPRATQRLMVTREEKKYAPTDIQFTDKYFLCNNILPKCVKYKGVSDYIVEQESMELPIVLTKASPPCTSEQLIRFDPTALNFPFQSNKTVVSSVTIINNTDHCVGFNQYADKGNVAWYHTRPRRGIMPPRSSQRLVVKRVLKRKGQQEDMLVGDKLFFWNMVVTQGVKAGCLIKRVAHEDATELPIVLDRTSFLCMSDELFQFDPPNLGFPFFPNSRVPTFSKVKIVNDTDNSVGFNTWQMNRNSARYFFDPSEGILPPRSTQAIKVRREPKETESQYMQCEDDVVGVWNGIVTAGVEAEDLYDFQNDEESKVLTIVLTKTIIPLSNSEELIRFDPAELSFPFLPNTEALSSVTVINNTGYCIGFNKHINKGNVAWYHTNPQRGIIQPGATQRLIVRRIPKEREQGDMQRRDRLYLWNMIVTEGVEASDLAGWMDDGDSTELPIVLDTTMARTSNELIQVDPAELRFPFSLNKRVSMLPINISNLTDNCVGFKINQAWPGNSAWYYVDPLQGILPPQSTQALKIRRVPKENESDNIQRKDDVVGVWSGILTKGVEVGDFPCSCCTRELHQQLPVVITKPGESSSPQGWIGRILWK